MPKSRFGKTYTSRLSYKHVSNMGSIVDDRNKLAQVFNMNTQNVMSNIKVSTTNPKTSKTWWKLDF